MNYVTSPAQYNKGSKLAIANTSTEDLNEAHRSRVKLSVDWLVFLIRIGDIPETG
jgi:hypothetical protein